MPDWKEIVGHHLRGALAGVDEADELVLELTTHLEEVFEECLARGLSEGDGAAVTLQEVPDWRVLARKVSRAKSKEAFMNNRTRSAWLPALATLLGASVCLMLMQRYGIRPRLYWIGHIAFTLYWPWLATLPVFGALGAYLAKLGRGTTAVRIIAALAPALVLLFTMCAILPLALYVDGFSPYRLTYFVAAVVNWVAIPASALLAGALPFLRSPSRTAC
jgi:hypothetical protein